MQIGGTWSWKQTNTSDSWNIPPVFGHDLRPPNLLPSRIGSSLTWQVWKKTRNKKQSTKILCKIGITILYEMLWSSTRNVELMRWLGSSSSIIHFINVDLNVFSNIINSQRKMKYGYVFKIIKLTRYDFTAHKLQT